MLSQNQVDDIFKTKLSRPASDFEYGQYKNSSISDLSQIDKTYGALNKGGSVADLAKYMGHDPSLAGRTALAGNFGIANYSGTTDQNKLLHDYLSGNVKQTLPADTFNGTVAPQPPTPPQDGNPNIDFQLQGGNKPQEAPVSPATPQSDASTGSIADAAKDFKPPEQDPVMTDTLKQYQDVQKQIADLDNTMASALTNKLNEISKNGGIVDDTQVRSMVEQENVPLTAKRRELVTQQGALGKTYQQMLAQYRQQQNDYYKGLGIAQKSQQNQATQGLATAKLSEAASRFSQTEADKTRALNVKQSDFAQTEADKAKALGVKQSEFAQSLDAKKWKLVKQAVYDDNATKVGEKLVLVNMQNPSEKRSLSPQEAASTGLQMPAGGTSGGPRHISTSSSSTSRFVTVPRNYPTSFITNGDAPTPDTVNLKAPSGFTLGAVYDDALLYLTEGKAPPSRGKPLDRKYLTEVKGKAANIAAALGMQPPQIKALYAADKKATTESVSRITRIDTQTASLTAQFPRLAELAKSVGTMGITESDLTAGRAKVAEKFGSVEAGNYAELIQTVRSDYSQLQAAIGGGKGGAYLQDPADKAIPIGETPEQYLGKMETIIQSAKNAREAQKGVLSQLFDNVKMGGEQKDAPANSDNSYDAYLKAIGQ